MNCKGAFGVGSSKTLCLSMLLSSCLFVATKTELRAQELSTSEEKIIPVTFTNYAKRAIQKNIGMVAQRYSIEQADQHIALAKIYPNPSISIGNASGDITGQELQQQLFAGITQTIPTNGKRKETIRIAKTEKEISVALFDDALRQLRSDLAKKYIDVLIAQLVLDRHNKTYQQLNEQLKTITDQGKISALDLKRIEIELKQDGGSLVVAQEDLSAAIYELNMPLSSFNRDSVYSVSGKIAKYNKSINLIQLINSARENRSDVVAAKLNRKRSEQQYALAKANRVKDLEITLGENYFTEATNRIAPTPSYSAITLLVSTPIPFSNARKADLNAAKINMYQTEASQLSTEATIEIEIRKAYHSFSSASTLVNLYEKDLITNSEEVLNQEINNFKQGQVSFIELSESHRKLNEIYVEYYHALKAYAYSLVELQYYAGIWDLSFE